MEGNIILIF